MFSLEGKGGSRKFSFQKTAFGVDSLYICTDSEIR